jgi:hypothetical protein
MKTVKVNHVVLTLKLTALGTGMERDQIDEMINKRLSEGYDTVEWIVPKVNFDERNTLNDLVIVYIFKANEDEDGERVATKKPKKSKADA